jgi:hypothetical protein
LTEKFDCPLKEAGCDYVQLLLFFAESGERLVFGGEISKAYFLVIPSLMDSSFGE